MNEKSRNPLEKRPSSIRAKKVDYAALQEIKIEEVDCDDDFDDTGIVFQDKVEKWKKKVSHKLEIIHITGEWLWDRRKLFSFQP